MFFSSPTTCSNTKLHIGCFRVHVESCRLVCERDLIASCQVFYNLSLLFLLSLESSSTVAIGSLFFSSVVLADTFINDMQIASFWFLWTIHQSPVNVCMENVRIYILMGVYSSVDWDVGWFIDNQCILLANTGNAKLMMYFTLLSGLHCTSGVLASPPTH